MRTHGLVQKSESILEVLGVRVRLKDSQWSKKKITSELVRLSSLMCTGLHKHFYRKVVNVLVPESWTTSSAAFIAILK